MKLISFRVALFALALAVQAIAGGFSVAATNVQGVYAERCGSGETGDYRAPLEHHRNHHDCLQCQGCVGGPSPIATYSIGTQLIAFRAPTLLRFSTAFVSLAPSRLAVSSTRNFFAA